ncbi:hypothetical protein CT0861_00642 [Colletotrichum tofieldiae]|uniref:Uncharacterized protein n=1 Tax=Colletotrichum tofieldiae TaxID=708197 RepID=A0A166TKS8_9PEZI|nr:hypothetical protein CT0861_00642 [Colletotrichum tofieldiae]
MTRRSPAPVRGAAAQSHRSTGPQAISADNPPRVFALARKKRRLPLGKPLQDPHGLLVVDLPLLALARVAARVRPHPVPEPANHLPDILLPHAAADDHLQLPRARTRLAHHRLQHLAVRGGRPGPARGKNPLEPAGHQIPHSPLDLAPLPGADNLVKGPVEGTGQPARGLGEPPVPLDVDHQRLAVPPQHPEHEPVAPLRPQRPAKGLDVAHHGRELVVRVDEVHAVRRLPARPDHDPHGHREPLRHALEVRRRRRRAANGIAPPRVELDALRAEGLGVQSRGRREDWYFEAGWHFGWLTMPPCLAAVRFSIHRGHGDSKSFEFVDKLSHRAYLVTFETWDKVGEVLASTTQPPSVTGALFL